MSPFDLPTASSQTQRVRSVLLKAGVSVGGVEQLLNAQPIGRPQDRQAIARLIDGLLGGGGDAAIGPNAPAVSYTHLTLPTILRV